MSLSTSIITSIKDEELDIFKKQYTNLADLRKEIDRLKKEYKKNKDVVYKNNINFFIDMYNIRVGYLYYKKVK
jgi:hypothetical protein